MNEWTLFGNRHSSDAEGFSLKGVCPGPFRDMKMKYAEDAYISMSILVKLPIKFYKLENIDYYLLNWSQSEITLQFNYIINL